MQKDVFAINPEFQTLATRLSRFLDGLEAPSDTDRARRILVQLQESLAETSRKGTADVRLLKETLDLLGLDRGSFEEAVRSIVDAAKRVHEAVPELEGAEAETIDQAIREGLAANRDAAEIVAAHTVFQPKTARLAFLGDIPDTDAPYEGIDDCALGCSLAAAIAWAAALVAALERSIFCGGLAAVAILALVCLGAVALAYVLAAKAADNAYKACIEACNN